MTIKTAWRVQGHEAGPPPEELRRILRVVARTLNEELAFRMVRHSLAETLEERAHNAGAIAAVRTVQTAMAEAMLSETWAREHGDGARAPEART